MNLIKTKALIDQHIHGAFGVDFLTCSVDELIDCSIKLKQSGIVAFCPTLATASIEILKRQIAVIKKAQTLQTSISDTSKIIGVNLEACFISEEKKGIHSSEELLAPSINNYKLLEDEIIKIVTIAPELDKNNELTSYLKSNDVKVFAGHTCTADLADVDGVTHLFNAMKGIHHRERNTVTSALIDDSLYCELIADGFHVDYDNIKLVLKSKPLEKLILISDALPIAKSELKEMNFCSQKIYLKNGKAMSKEGTLAGSSMLLDEIVRKLVINNILDLKCACDLASNSEKLFGLEIKDCLLWDKNLNIVDILSE